MPVAERSIQNLKPFPKGHKPVKSPGRPRRNALIDCLQYHYELGEKSPKHMRELIRDLQRKCPQEIAHYLAGKPLEQIRLEATMTTAVEPATLEAAAATVRALLGVQDGLAKLPAVITLPDNKNAPEAILERNPEAQKPE